MLASKGRSTHLKPPIDCLRFLLDFVSEYTHEEVSTKSFFFILTKT